MEEQVLLFQHPVVVPTTLFIVCAVCNIHSLLLCVMHVKHIIPIHYLTSGFSLFFLPISTNHTEGYTLDISFFLGGGGIFSPPLSTY